jgi:phospholipid transport system substrate-binding protein
MVYDVITDEVSMVRNYRQQFNKIITTESYDALLAKMRKRIKEADVEKTSATQ